MDGMDPKQNGERKTSNAKTSAISASCMIVKMNNSLDRTTRLVIPSGAMNPTYTVLSSLLFTSSFTKFWSHPQLYLPPTLIAHVLHLYHGTCTWCRCRSLLILMVWEHKKNSNASDLVNVIFLSPQTEGRGYIRSRREARISYRG